MTTQPQWQGSGQGDLLELVAQGSPATPTADEEWEWFVECLSAVATWTTDGRLVNPNRFRDALDGRIKPQRVGAFTSRALARGLVEYTGRYVVSTDTGGRNSGKPCRELRWIGGDSDA